MIPVINENDTVSTDEIRFGDNDTLAAMVAGQSPCRFVNYFDRSAGYV